MPLNAATFNAGLWLDHGSVDASGRAREKNTAMDSPRESSSRHSESQERALGSPWVGPENGSNEQVRLFGSRDHDAGNNNRGEATEAACGRSYPSSSSAVNPALYYDPYSPVEVKVSLLDREDDEEEEEGGTSVTGAAKGDTDDNSLENWLEMSDRGDRKEKPVYRRRRGEPSQGPSSALRSPSIAAAGTAGLLEMEDPDVKDDHDNDEEEDEEEEVVFERVGGGGRTNRGIEDDDDDDVYGSSSSSNAPIQTSSGLLLTHRKLPGEQEEDLTSASITSGGGTVRSRHAPSSQPPPGRLEVEHEQSNYYHPHRNHAQGAGGYRHSSSLYPPDPPPGGGGRFASNRFVSSFVPLQRWLSFVRLWVVVSAAVLMLGMTVVVHHMRHETSSSTTAASDNGAANSRVVTNIYQEDKSFSSYNNAENNYYYPDQIILLPLPEGALANHQRIHSHSHHRNLLVDKDEEVDRGLHHLFLQWKKKHDKEYSSHREHAHRFQIWKKNHLRIQKRNEAHGPCKLTAQPVFGTNHLSDLTEEEFQSQYLSGYGVPKSASDPSSQHDHAPPVLDPNAAAVPTEQRQVRRQRDQQRRRLKDTWYEPAKQTSIESCDWYDMSCILRYIFETYFYGLGRTMEPIYDADSYPLMVDWRAVGAVTDVHSQGSCGACWAITAVETVESANYLSTDTLVDLSETEVIACTEDTEWCSGGWPQSAFEYIINQKGIPLETELPYDADYLLTLTEARESGDADGTVQAYMQSVCPGGKNGGGGGGHSGDNDKNNNNGGGSSSTRYGSIKGYGYATEKCVCYTDGSGCDCDSQNEGLAVRNVATYGPAVVCVDASTWQDYNGGIMTADSGCSSKFLDVNHCVQVVGYAFATADGSDSEQQTNSHSGSGDRNGGGSKDNSDRIGYWIVRNQWSTYWGMSGFAYVAMGENTCGILNDMIQVYT